MKRFNDKAVIVTGADSSLGRVTAMKLAREGANVILVGSNSKVLQYIAADLPEDHTWINSGNHLAITYRLDEATPSDELVTHVLQKYQKIDVLININTSLPLEGSLVQALAQSKGSVVNVGLLSDNSSEWSLQDYQQQNHHLAENTKQLALTHSTNGIRVNAVNVGLTADDRNSHDSRQLFLQHSPLGDLVSLEDASEAITFLASEEARMITGVTLPVDGGLSLTY